MAYAVVFYFDTLSEIPIRRVWDELQNNDLNSRLQTGTFRPHMTLAIYESIKCTECEAEIKHFGAKSGIFSIKADHFGIFPQQSSVIFIAPPPMNKLMDLHQKIHQILIGKADGSWKMYQPGHWVPHITITQDIKKEDLPAALEICMEINLPLDLKITQIGLVEFEPTIQLFNVDLSI